MFAKVAHTGRSVHAPEEIDRIEQLVDALLGSDYTINKKGITEEGLIDSNKILVIAPYNVQVNKLEERLAGRARVGTVDRFQGREAPVVLYSQTSSTTNQAPRGTGFCLDKNRINVALSRSQCLTVFLANKSFALDPPGNTLEARMLNNIFALKWLKPKNQFEHR